LPNWHAEILDRLAAARPYCGPESRQADRFGEEQLRKLAFALTIGITACARSAPAPLTPVAASPSVTGPPPRCCGPDSSPVRPAVPRNPATLIQDTTTATAPDTLPEEAFLDSLRALAADSSARPVASVAPEVVRSEAASMFARPVAAAAGATWDIDVANYASHERVLYYLDYFSGRARRHFEIYLERLGRYDSIIRTRLAAAGLPQDLIYLAMIESGFNQNARSRAGAVGLWQFIPGTARRYGLTVDSWVDERRDPFLATDAAIRMLSELNNRFGSLYLAAAAYNSGPGKIARGLRRYDFGALDGDDRYFALAEGTFLRRETRDYVPKLIAAALVAKEPERWGFTGITPWQPLRYDSLEVRFAVGVDVLARLSGTSRDQMEELNPGLYRGVTPPDRTVWVRVPEGTREALAERLATLPASERVTVVVHIVERGETLSKIARRYHVTVDDITGANRGVQARRLRRGQRLVIPTSLMGASRVSSASSRARVARRSVTATRAGPTTRTAPAGTSGPAAVSRRVHIVRDGETLGQIARNFNVPLEALLRANGLSARSTIRPGQTVRIPS
jgi:membrane-bound lytic murein transglycosylase D